MKNYQLLEIKENWKNLKELSGSKGYYLPLVKNIKLIDTELEVFELMKEKTQEFDKFLKDKDNLLIKHANKDDKGNPIKTVEVVNGIQYYKYDISDENKETVDKLGKELLEQYKDVLEDMKQRELKYVNEMESDCTIEFHKIKEADLPSEMKPEQLELIYDFVDFS